MSIIAGIVSITPGRLLGQDSYTELRSHISRISGDTLIEYMGEGYCIFKLDIGAYQSPAHQIAPGGSCMFLTGHPYLNMSSGGEREHDVAMIHEALDQRRYGIFKQARGVFCLSYFDPANQTLILATDKLGIRPIYYAYREGIIYFSSALRILESLTSLPKQINIQGVIESVSCGYPLADRTPYKDIYTIREGEIITVDSKVLTKSSYWRWDRLEPVTCDYSEQVKETYERFSNAVNIRLGMDRRSISFLSGGLDSRSIVSELHKQGVDVHTFNFSPVGSQDQKFAELFSKQIGTLHEEYPIMGVRANPYWTKILSLALNSSKALQKAMPEHPRLVWSGDGGSVSLGHVYLTKSMIANIQRGNLGQAIEELLTIQNIGFPYRILKKRYRSEVDSVIRDGIIEEIKRLECNDLGRSLHLFLMFNDQRRHLAKHFEDIDLYRIEYLLPFFDSHFLEAVFSVDVQRCLYHRFYMDVFELFPSFARQTPWQTYPGHIPCPIPMEGNYLYQWDKWETDWRMKQLKRGSESYTILRGFFLEKTLRSLISRNRLILAAMLHGSGIRDYSYLAKAMNRLLYFSRACFPFTEGCNRLPR